jgi:hypothetical protein
MKLNKLHYLSNILFDNYSILQITKNISNNAFIIILNTHNMSNNDLLALKNELFKYEAKSIIIKAEYIKTLFSNYFSFFKSFCMCIFTNDIIKFNSIIKLLKNTMFFFSFNKCFSNITNTEILLYQNSLYEHYIVLHYIIYKLINNIIFIILFYIALFLNLLKNSTSNFINKNEKTN